MSGALSAADRQQIAEAVQGSSRRFCALRMAGETVAAELAAGGSSVPVKVCQLTPVSLITDRMREYRQDDYHGLRRQHRGHAVAGLLPAADGA